MNWGLLAVCQMPFFTLFWYNWANFCIRWKITQRDCLLPLNSTSPCSADHFEFAFAPIALPCFVSLAPIISFFLPQNAILRPFPDFPDHPSFPPPFPSSFCCFILPELGWIISVGPSTQTLWPRMGRCALLFLLWLLIGQPTAPAPPPPPPEPQAYSGAHTDEGTVPTRRRRVR